jgi:hypothetical protein
VRGRWTLADLNFEVNDVNEALNGSKCKTLRQPAKAMAVQSVICGCHM